MDKTYELFKKWVSDNILDCNLRTIFVLRKSVFEPPTPLHKVRENWHFPNHLHPYVFTYVIHTKMVPYLLFKIAEKIDSIQQIYFVEMD